LSTALLVLTALTGVACSSTQPETAPAGEAVPVVANTEWNQFRGDPKLTGVAPASLPTELTLAWTYEAGESIESSAAIVEETVYVGSQSGELLALELETGKLRWKYKAAEGIGESSPTVRDGVVYIGDLAGVFHAVEAETGKGLWTFKAEAEVRASPVVAGGKVLFGSYDGNFYALSAASGELLWKVTTDGPVHSTASIEDGIAHFAGCDGVFRAVHLEDGEEELRVVTGAYTGASPPLVKRKTFFGTFENEVLGIDLGEKEVLWRYQHPTREFPYNSSAAVADGKVVVGGRDKMVHCLDMETGEELWNYRTKARVESSPVIAGGRVYIGSNDGRFYVFRLEDGEKLWEFEAGAPISASPAIAAGYLVIGDQDGRLYAFQ
jgi:outer membrane protein assembly factor BamB